MSSGDPGPGLIIEFLGLEQGKGYVPVEQCIVGQVDPLLAPLAEESLDLVAAVGKGGGFW